MSIRYISSEEIKGSITSKEAKFDMALATLSYIRSSALDPELDNDQLEKNLTFGRYRLLEYFAFHWPGLTLAYAKKAYWIPHKFIKLLTRVAHDARNYEYEGDMDSLENIIQNKELQESSPEGYEILCAALQFHLDEKSADWNLGNSKQASVEHDR
jgi:hypothetical protein